MPNALICRFCYDVYMPGKAKESQHKSQQQEIAEKKAQVVSFFEKTGMKTAAANFVGRDIQTIRDWEAADDEFRTDMLRAKAKFAQSNQRKVRLDNLYANLYPDDFKPPTQKVDATVTTIEGQSAEDLLAEAKRLGLDTSPYESLLTRNTDTRAQSQDPDQEGT